MGDGASLCKRINSKHLSYKILALSRSGLSRGKAFPPHPHFHPVPGFHGPWVAPLLPRRPLALLVGDSPKSCHPSATGLGSRLRRASGTFRGPRSPVFRAASPYSDLRVRYFSYLRRQLFIARFAGYGRGPSLRCVRLRRFCSWPPASALPNHAVLSHPLRGAYRAIVPGRNVRGRGRVTTLWAGRIRAATFGAGRIRAAMFGAGGIRAETFSNAGASFGFLGEKTPPRE